MYYYLVMRIGEAAEYLGMSVAGVRKAASEGRLPSRRIGAGHRVFDRADLNACLGRPALGPVDAVRERVGAWYWRVSGSTGPVSSVASQETWLRETARGAAGSVGAVRGGVDRALLSEVGVTVEVMRERGDTSPAEESRDERSWRCWRRLPAGSLGCGRRGISAG